MIIWRRWLRLIWRGVYFWIWMVGFECFCLSFSIMCLLLLFFFTILCVLFIVISFSRLLCLSLSITRVRNWDISLWGFFNDRRMVWKVCCFCMVGRILGSFLLLLIFVSCFLLYLGVLHRKYRESRFYIALTCLWTLFRWHTSEMFLCCRWSWAVCIFFMII